MSGLVLVTGAGGNVGREVVRALRARGLPLRAADRSGSTSRPDGVESTRLDFRDRATWGPSVEGCTTLFLLRPPAIADVEETLNPFVDCARAAGVQHTVFLSVEGAGKNTFIPHAKVEKHLQQDSAYTSLRVGFFAQNLQDAYLSDILEHDRIYVPAGTRRKVNFVDVRDVAEVAAKILEDPAGYRGAALTLTGPEPVAWTRVTEALSSASGRPIRYVAASVVGYLWHVWRSGRPLGAAVVQTVLHTLLRAGTGETQDETLERLLGRPSRTIEEYVRDHAALWSRGS